MNKTEQTPQLAWNQFGEAVEMYKSNPSASLIAKHFGVEESYIIEVLKEYGLTPVGDSLSPREVLQDARMLLQVYGGNPLKAHRRSSGGDGWARQKLIDRIEKVLAQVEV